LQAIEQDAAQSFLTLSGYAFCAALPVRDEEEHGHARTAGLALLAEWQGQPCGFLLALPADGRAHLLEVSVGRQARGRGVGRRLIASFADWAERHGFREATLTTFRDVPWNAPFYARLGFETFAPGIDRPALQAIIAEEVSSGFHRMPRVAMRKPLA